MGDNIEIQDGQLIVGAAKRLKDDGSELLFDGNAWVAVQVKLKNTGSKTWAVSQTDFRVDAPGGTSSVLLINNDLPYLEETDLEPGKSVVGWIGLQIPDGATDVVLHYERPESAQPVDVSLAQVWVGGGETTELSTQLKTESKRRDTEYDRTHVDKAEYASIKNGMSLSRVQSIIGWAGEESASSGSYVIRSWTNPDGSGATVTFENGRVTAKAQVGL